MKNCLLILLLLFGMESVACSAPQLAAERLNFDFGEILQGERVEQVFRFNNAGDDVLQVGNIRSSCGCTAAILSATRIAPGDFGEVRITFDSKGFKGGIHKTVTVDTNDPSRRQVVFSLAGNVKTELLLQPERVNWGRVKENTLLNSTVILKNLGNKVIQLQPPTVTNPAISAELSNLLLSPGGQVELQITSKFPEQKKRLGGYVIIATDYPKVPQIRVPVSARLSK